MKKFCDTYYDLPEEGKISEKVIMARAISTIAIIAGCLIAMSVSAYAFFCHSVTSELVNIKAASFDTDITIVGTTDPAATADILVVTEEVDPANNVETTDQADMAEVTEALEDTMPAETVPSASPALGTVTIAEKFSSDNNCKYYTAYLQKGITYNVTIKPSDRGTTRNGFVLVGAMNCNDTYHTQQLGTDVMVVGGETNEIGFTLAVTESTYVIFIPHWGTSSNYKQYSEKVDFYITDGESVSLVVNGMVPADLSATPTPMPSATPLPEETEAPTATPLPGETPVPSATPLPGETEAPTPSASPVVGESPAPSEEPEAGTSPAPSTPTEPPVVAPEETPSTEGETEGSTEVANPESSSGTETPAAVTNLEE